MEFDKFSFGCSDLKMEINYGLFSRSVEFLDAEHKLAEIECEINRLDVGTANIVNNHGEKILRAKTRQPSKSMMRWVDVYVCVRDACVSLPWVGKCEWMENGEKCLSVEFITHCFEHPANSPVAAATYNFEIFNIFEHG